MLVWCFVELWSPIKTRELVRQVIFFESKGFHVGNVVSADFFRVYGFNFQTRDSQEGNMNCNQAVQKQPKKTTDERNRRQISARRNKINKIRQRVAQ